MKYSPTSVEKDLFKVITLLEDEKEAMNFLRDLLTEPEIKEFANRWRVVQMLQNKTAYKTIERETGMSSTTIARVQKWLTDGMSGYKTMLKKINNTSSIHHSST